MIIESLIYIKTPILPYYTKKITYTYQRMAKRYKGKRRISIY